MPPQYLPHDHFCPGQGAFTSPAIWWRGWHRKKLIEQSTWWLHLSKQWPKHIYQRHFGVCSLCVTMCVLFFLQAELSCDQAFSCHHICAAVAHWVISLQLCLIGSLRHSCGSPSHQVLVKIWSLPCARHQCGERLLLMCWVFLYTKFQRCSLPPLVATIQMKLTLYSKWVCSS